MPTPGAQINPAVAIAIDARAAVASVVCPLRDPLGTIVHSHGVSPDDLISTAGIVRERRYAGALEDAEKVIKINPGAKLASMLRWGLLDLSALGGRSSHPH